jgi:vacuolar-type H+-ATPase subunit F/Vma7
MPVPCYVGDEVTAAGFRLAGVATIVPDRGHETEALASACAQYALVLLCAAVAQRIEPRVLGAALAGLVPPVALLPDVQGAARVPDLAARVAQTLGLQG